MSKSLQKYFIYIQIELINGKSSIAEYIKAKIIDFIIVRHPEIILGNEVMYGTKRKLVDLLMLDTSNLIGIWLNQ